MVRGLSTVTTLPFDNRVQSLTLTLLTASFADACRVIWALVGLLMLGLGVWLITQLLQDCLSYPSSTKISSQFSNEYYLPAITICNINLMNRTKMEEDTIKLRGKRGKFGDTATVYELYQALQQKYKVSSYM